MISKRSYSLLFSFLLVFVVSSSQYVSAIEVQQKTNALIIGAEIKIQSKILNEERPIWIYLPENYSASPNSRFPVLYVLDGDFHFHHITGAVEHLVKRERIPPMIVIAIPFMDYERRPRDLSPTSAKGDPPVAAADKFLAFLQEELIPFVDKNYRSAPYRILFSHSRAGLFSIYALIEQPKLIDAYISISPSLYWDDRLMFKKMEVFLRDNPSIKKVLYLSAADGDSDLIKFSTADFAGLLKKISPQGLEVQYSFYENETHGSIVHRAFYNNLEHLYSSWRLTPKQIETMTYEQLKEHYSKLSERYGYEMSVPTPAKIQKTYQLIQAQQLKEAAEHAKSILEQNPDLSEAHFLFGLSSLANGML
jgi:uncharacterized protein